MSDDGAKPGNRARPLVSTLSLAFVRFRTGIPDIMRASALAVGAVVLMLLHVTGLVKLSEALRSRRRRSDADYDDVLALMPALPDYRRIPMHETLERAPPDEAAMIGEVARIAARTVLSNHHDARLVDSAAKALRDQHAKGHGCVRARFEVRRDLPQELRTRLFQAGAEYVAWVRFSNAAEKPKSDKSLDGRGMAIKLLDVPGTDAIASLIGEAPPEGPGAPCHDFLMTSHPVFLTGDVRGYLRFMRGFHSASAIVRLLTILYFLPYFLRVGLKRVDSPLTATYHSMSPYLFGDGAVVRYLARPLASEGEPRDRGAERRNGSRYLREALRDRLAPGAAHQPACFEFCVRLHGTPSPRIVENAARSWSERAAPTVPLARIVIEPQTFETADRDHLCENLSFNPWNSVPEHRPLGGINRMRLAVYLATSRMRHRLNFVASYAASDTGPIRPVPAAGAERDAAGTG